MRLVGLVILGATLAACGGGSGKAVQQTSAGSTPTMISGSVVAVGGSRWLLNDIPSELAIAAQTEASEGRLDRPCPDRPPRSDVTAGTQLEVLDEKGTTIGASALSAGTFYIAKDRTIGCRYEFDVAVTTAKFYKLRLAGQDVRTVEHRELEGTGWRLDLRVG